MSARNRQRPNLNQDADEERRLWKEIRERAKEVDGMVARSNAIGAEILSTETDQTAHIDKHIISSGPLDERLENLYRENLKLCEDVQHIIEGKSNDTNLLDSIHILAGLREASEESAAALSVSQSQGRRDANGKGGRALKKGSKASSGGGAVSQQLDDADEASAAPSPRHALPTASRVGIKDKSSRASSIPATREASVKLETDGVESVTSSTTSDPSHPRETANASSSSTISTARLTLRIGEIVFFKNKAKTIEGEGILCKVTNVIGEGKQRRYEIQDVDTDPQPGTGEVPAPWRASVSNLIQIPETNRALGDLGKGRNVLAQYPDTTTFYKAEVSTTWKAKEMGQERGEVVRLRFEGETENGVEQEVERRFVLTDK